jgi:hypothetical protein
MRFLCDEMLAPLARLLRAAGYDTYLASGGEPDAGLLKLAREEGRILVTRDKQLAADAPESVLVEGRGVEAEAESLSRGVVLNWSFAPFTRCVVDNARLREATLDEIDRMPRSAQERPGPFRACPACQRLYWPGSHVRRMGERLQGLSGGAPMPPRA